MDIYFRENTGMETAQEYKCDFFAIKYVGADLSEGLANCELFFWEREIDAVNNKVPNISRSVLWEFGDTVSIEAGIIKILSFDNQETTSGDFISLEGANKIS